MGVYCSARYERVVATSHYIWSCHARDLEEVFPSWLLIACKKGLLDAHHILCRDCKIDTALAGVWALTKGWRVKVKLALHLRLGR